MRSFRDIKHDYRFMEEDEQRLAHMRQLMEEHGEEIMTTLHLWIMGTRDAAQFFNFHISVFIGVALVTMIRETMIATLKHDRPESIYYLIAAILVIGLVYWLVVRTEDQKK